MQNKRLGKNLMMVAFSRMVSLASSVLGGFLLPKILSVSDYGFYKVFTLYAVYTALLHFGFVDGILLKIAGKDYKELELPKMRTYTRFFMVFETLVSLIMIGFGFFFASGEYLFIVFMLAMNMTFVNITTYYQFVSQAIQRFSEYSAKSLIVSVAKLIFVAILSVLYFSNLTAISYRVYLIGINALDFFVMIWYVSIYREITFGKRETVGSLRKDIIDVFKTGIVLTLAYQVSHLILALDRQFVNILFTTEVFAVYSFAYNIVSLISTMISSVSVVLLPMLKKRRQEHIIESYKISMATVAVVASAGLLLYFPLVSFIEWFLPAYHGSVKYIAIVLPAFLFTAVITVVMFTIAKVIDMNLDFFKDSCIVLCCGLLTNSVAYALFKSPEAISYASLMVMMIWFIISGGRLKRRTGVGVYKAFIYLIIISAGFLFISGFIKGIFIGLIAYSVWLFMWSIVFYKTNINKLIKSMLSK